ncbi:MAG: hypothetical protein ABSH52_12815 [Terriglobia bacterium]|jgi:hypothetical protein
MKEGQLKPKLVSRKLKKFFVGGDATPLRGDDFRSARLTIPARAFAYVEKFRVSLDPVDLETWTELQAVPDDVCLQITEYHGSALKVQRELHSAWIEKIGYAKDDSLMEDTLNQVAFEVEAEWQACTFEGLHGFYRQAISTLRAAMERTIFALRYQNVPFDPHFKNWLEGQELLSFQPICDQLVKMNPIVRAVNDHMIKSGLPRFVWRKQRNGDPQEWVGRLYADLCHYSHCRPKHASGDLWKGPGPVYDPEAFKLTDRFYRETSAVCWIAAKIARPSLVLPEVVAGLVA